MATEKISSTEPSSNQYAELAVEEKGERLEEGITTATTEVGHADSDYKATRARNAVLFASALMVSVFVILNLPYQYVERYATGGVAIDVDFQNQMSALPIMAGMPFRYSIRYAGDHPIEAFSWSALMLNLVSLVASIAVVGVYLYRKKIKQKRSGRASLTISDLLVATFLTAVGIGGYQYLEMEQTKLLKYQSSMAAQGHGIAISAWLPKVIADCIPQAYARLCCSVRGVRLESPSDAVLNETLRADNLTSFRIGGDGYDLRLLDQLSGRIHLDDLRIAGRSIDQGTVRVIGALPRLETLNLIRSNVPAVAISSLELPKLRRLDLRMTDLTLAELGTPPWSKNVVELSLPRPYDRSDKIEIENWPELRRLTVNDLELQVNSRLLEIKLANLPKLEELKLDQLQCYALQLTQLPVLPEITLLKDNIANRLARGEKYPSTLWVRRFEIDQLPKLASISFYVSEVEQIRLSRLPELKGAYVDVSRYDSSGYRHSNAISQRSKVVLVDGLAASDGPEIIDFNGVDLSGVELAPLRANSRLAELRLVGTGIGLEQLTKLSPMPQLMKLQVDSSVFTPAKLGRLLDAFPSIESLQFEDSQDAAFVFRQSTEDLHLSDHPNLKTLLAESLSQGVFRSVQIRNMPSLNSAFDFAWVENDVHIQGAPNLRGLSFAAPLPATVQLSDLQNLEYFAAGGDRVDDSIVEAISHSERLATLTLAYASASSESLKSIPVASLKHLCLAGCNVDDEVVRAWGDLTQLESLDLSQTQITGVSLGHLLASKSLQSVRLGNCQIKPSELASIGTMPTLQVLSLVNIGIDPDTLRQLTPATGLRELDLSGTTVANGIFDLIADWDLQFLVLNDCELNSRKVVELMRRKTSLVLDPIGSDLDPSVSAFLMSEQRIVDRSDFVEFEAMKQWQQSINSTQPTFGQVAMGLVPNVQIPITLTNVDDFSAFGIYGGQSKNVSSEPTESSGGSNRSGFGGLMESFFGGARSTEQKADEVNDELEGTSL